ncbi:MAG: DUF4474 domain-containing protein [Clostridia bacterium]|nr:DUF4474 domain-containing protein [Clostridia bacterium]
MKLFRRLTALTLAVLLLLSALSGCKILDTARAVILKNRNTETSAPAPSENVPPVSVPPVQTAVVNAEPTSPQVVQPSPAPATSAPTTAATVPEGTTAPAATQPAAPANDEEMTFPEVTGGEPAPQLSLDELQRMLFDKDVAHKVLTTCGFEYDADQGIYYSTMYPIQRIFGYNIFYDLFANQFGMFFSTERIKFDYAGKNWMVQIWKGQYGITAGGEIGLYNKPMDRPVQYDTVPDDEMIVMAFDFYNMNQKVFSRGPEKHWWLTGFKLFDVGSPMLIDLVITLEFPNDEMADAFLGGLRETCKNTTTVDRMTYSRSGNTFTIKW